MESTPTSERQRLDRLGLFHLMVVYVVWGSTYLAIRLTVREGAGFPPFLMATMRVAVASTVLTLVVIPLLYFMALGRNEAQPEASGD